MRLCENISLLGIVSQLSNKVAFKTLFPSTAFNFEHNGLNINFFRIALGIPKSSVLEKTAFFRTILQRKFLQITDFIALDTLAINESPRYKASSI